MSGDALLTRVSALIAGASEDDLEAALGQLQRVWEGEAGGEEGEEGEAGGEEGEEGEAGGEGRRGSEDDE